MTAQAMPDAPHANSLTYRQLQGWACCWCHTSLMTRTDVVSAGRARDDRGWSVEVYACGPNCPKRPRRPWRNSPNQDRQEGTQ